MNLNNIICCVILLLITLYPKKDKKSIGMKHNVNKSKKWEW